MLARALFIFILYSSYIYPSAMQVWLQNGIWKLLSYKGIYSNHVKYKDWESDPRNIIEDRADGKPTYITPSTLNNHSYQLLSTTSNTIPVFANPTVQAGSTVSIFAIHGSTSVSSKATLLDAFTSIQMKFSKSHPKDAAQSTYVMYVSGGSIPAIKITFQNNYQGDMFRVKFADEDDAYIGYFNYENTFDNPAILINEKTINTQNTKTQEDIKNIFDFNITDNNISSMLDNTFSKKDDIKKPESSQGESVIIHHYDNVNNLWDSYNSQNTQSKANSFSKLTVGEAYWIKASSDIANRDANSTRLGLITSTSEQLRDDYLSNISNGWNLLSFKDSSIRYALTGIVVEENNLNTFSILVDHLEDSILFGSSGDSINISMAGNIATAYKNINASTYAVNLLYGSSKNIRAYPASTVDGNRSIVILSDELMNMTYAGAGDIPVLSLTGNKVIQSPILINVASAYTSRYGEYILALELNDLNNSEINASIEISTPSISSITGVATDLNDTNNTIKASAILRALEDSARNSAGELKTRVKVILLDIGGDGTKTYTQADIASQMNSVLLVSGERFSVSDTTYTKVYRYKRNGDFRIIGSKNQDIIMDNIININALENAFDNVKSVTNIDFHPLGQDRDLNEYFCITSNLYSNLDLLQNEDNATTLFTQVSLSNALVPNANKSFMQGAISKVYTGLNLLDTRVNLDISTIDLNTSFFSQVTIRVRSQVATTGNTSPPPAIIDDLRTSPIWSLDFPTNSIVHKLAKYNKKIDVILSSSTGIGGGIFWETTDLTKDAKDWYGNNHNTDLVYDNDHQEVFRIKSDKGYWVKISNKTNINGAILSNSFMSKNIVPHFNNEIQNIANPISLTTHDINFKLTLFFNKSFINPLDNSFYDVVALIDGKKYHLRSEGGIFQLNIKNYEMGLKQKDYPIIIEAYDGLGNSLKETNLNHKFTLNLLKPPDLKMAWDNQGEISIINRGSLNIKAYPNYISDIATVRNNQKMDFDSTHFISRFNKKIGWENAQDSSLDGMVRLIKIVSKNNYNIYSNVLTIIYAPLKFGHILEIGKQDIDNVSNIPYSFFQKQYLTKRLSNSTTKQAFNKNGINGGVQLNKQLQAIEDNEKIQLVYFPAGGKSKEDSNQLEKSIGGYIMYIKVNKNDLNPIVSIKYISDMRNSIFYISYGKRLYIGRFANTNNFSSDRQSYILNPNLDFNILTIQNGDIPDLAISGRLIDFGSQIPSQPISKIP